MGEVYKNDDYYKMLRYIKNNVFRRKYRAISILWAASGKIRWICLRRRTYFARHFDGQSGSRRNGAAVQRKKIRTKSPCGSCAKYALTTFSPDMRFDRTSKGLSVFVHLLRVKTLDELLDVKVNLNRVVVEQIAPNVTNARFRFHSFRQHENFFRKLKTVNSVAA